MREYPAHASPGIAPAGSPRAPSDRPLSSLDLNRLHEPDASAASPPPLVSPALTPRRASLAADGQPHDRQSPPPPLPEDREGERPPRQLAQLPQVHCEVRARIPTTTGTEMWLHLYHNSADDKEHLAIVFGPHIRSRSLDAPRPGETERDRMIRGAYVGTLFPGRTSSRIEQIKRDAGVSSPPPPPPRPGADHRPMAAPNESSASSPVSETSSDTTESSYPPELGPPLVRIHSECYTGETVWSARCDCGEQLDEAARLMSAPATTTTTPTTATSPTSTPGSDPGGGISSGTPQAPSSGGVIIYLRQEGRGIGLLSKLKAYNLQDLGHDTMEANLLLRHPGDARSYGLATAMLLDLGLGGAPGIRLLTNNPDKVRAVEGPAREIRVAGRVPMIPLAWQSGGAQGVHGPEVEKYISTKIEKFKHMFSA